MKNWYLPFNCIRETNKPFKWTKGGAWLFLFLFLAVQLPASAKELAADKTSDLKIVITGTVMNAKGTPLAGVTILVKGTNKGTSTDESGNFSIDAPGNSTLEVSFVGYASQEVKVNNQTSLSIVLIQSNSELNEVVVIGYGTAKKKDLTGAVTSVSGERLVDKPVGNLGQALQNKVAGVQVIQNGAGIPGGQPMIRIRGTNSINSNNDPLFVVDGIVGVSNPLATLNPQDIASLDVLKDASATAIYGARGANGVIIITTKRGKIGKPQLDYNGSVF